MNPRGNDTGLRRRGDHVHRPGELAGQRPAGPPLGDRDAVPVPGEDLPEEGGEGLCSRLLSLFSCWCLQGPNVTGCQVAGIQVGSHSVGPSGKRAGKKAQSEAGWRWQRE